MLYLITFLHQTTTLRELRRQHRRLYLITFLHQTTTLLFGPKLRYWLYLITFLHQTTTYDIVRSYYGLLYLITFLHQTTTSHVSCTNNHPFTKEYTSTNSFIRTRRSRSDAIFRISKNKNNANSEKFQLLGNFRLGTFDFTHKIQNIAILLIRNTQNTRISRRRHRSTYPIDMHLHILL